MERIICDSYDKERAPEWTLNKDSAKTKEFNRKIAAVNNMYGWLYEKGILKEISFDFKDYPEAAYFAFDVKDLEPYRKDMERSCCEDAALAVQHIFDVDYAPCVFTGAIELAWHMSSYRNVDGCIGRSRECSLIKEFNNKAASEVLAVKKSKGIKEAVKHAFILAEFEPDRFDRACEYYKDWVNVDDINGDRDFLYSHADKLIYCYENKKDLIDFDFWVQYENLVGEKISWDEYLAIDSKFDGDPHDVELNDVELIAGFKKSLQEYRQGKDIMHTLDDCINAANIIKEKDQSTSNNIFVFSPLDYEEAKKSLLNSNEEIMNWKNSGYTCRLERNDNGEIFYDLHLTRTGTTIMYGEQVEVLSEDVDIVNVRVANDENECTSINKDFFNKNFVSSAVLKCEIGKNDFETELER